MKLRICVSSPNICFWWWKLNSRLSFDSQEIGDEVQIFVTKGYFFNVAKTFIDAEDFMQPKAFVKIFFFTNNF